MATKPKFGQYSDIQIPPESTGPAIYNLVRYELDLSSSAGGDPAVGDNVTGGNSAASGTIIRVRAGLTGTDFDLSVVLDEDSPSLLWTDTESLTITGGKSGTLDSSEIIYTNAITVVGGDDPFNAQNVDPQGSAFVRFEEGNQQLDAFGLSRTSKVNSLAEYTFHYSTEAEQFNDILIGGSSTVTHLPDQSSIELSIDTASGDKAERTSVVYFPYHPGQGRLIMMTVGSGDAGKANVRRRWGYNDDENGVFFQLDGTTLSVVLRSNVTGSVVDTVINQSAWNGDRLNGSLDQNNLSNVTIAPENINVYWIDLQWLGAGRIRFGIMNGSGERITAHTIENANLNVNPYMTTGTLPIRYGIDNTTTSGSASTLKLTCALIATDGNIGDLSEYTNTDLHAWKRSARVTGITAEVVIANFRAAALINGITNRKLSIPKELDIEATGDTLIIRVRKGTVLGGTPIWSAANTGSSFEVDTAGTVSTPGVLIEAFFAPIGVTNHDVSGRFKSVLNSMHTNADGTAGEVFTVTAESVNAAATCDFILEWFDLGR